MLRDSTFTARDDERRVFGKAWCGPKSFAHFVPVLVAKYAQANSDGHDAEVWCAAGPARFYEVRSGRWLLGMGSGTAELARDIAVAISEGMLTVEMVR